MNDDNDTPGSGDVPLCIWCGLEISQRMATGTPVCRRCQAFLRLNGYSEREIFDRDFREQERD